MLKYTGENAIKDFVKMRIEDLERITKVYENISNFVDEATKSINQVEKKVNSIKCLPAKNGAIVVDSTKRLLSFLRIEWMSGAEDPRTLYIMMTPPLLPHFFLAIAYVTAKTKLVPTMIMKSSPIVSLSSLLIEVNLASASVAQFALSMRFLEPLARYEISILPLDARYMKLSLKPKKSNTLYLCELGLSTTPVSNSYNVEIDLSSVPPISDEVLASKEFISLRNVLDEVMGELRE
ncbi:MAG: hypothetical protein QW611_05065 [Ignisphaera sp.]